MIFAIIICAGNKKKKNSAENVHLFLRQQKKDGLSQEKRRPKRTKGRNLRRNFIRVFYKGNFICINVQGKI